MTTDRRLTLLGTAVVLVVGAVVALRTVETDQFVASVRTADPAVLILAMVVYALSWPLRGRRYDDILAAMGQRCGTVFTTGIVFVSQTANLVVPARAGDGLRAYLLNAHREITYAKGAASLTVERLFDLLALVGLGALALGWLAVTGDAGWLGETRSFLGPAALAGGLGFIMSALIVALARHDGDVAGWLRRRVDGPKLRRLLDAIIRFGRDLEAVATTPRALIAVGASSLCLWALDVLTAVLVLWAVAGPAGMGVVEFLAVGTLAVTVGNLAKVLPLSQGGIGLYEAAFTALVVAISPVGSGVALAAAILDHALKNAVTALGGAGASLAFNVSLRAAPSDHDAEPADF